MNKTKELTFLKKLADYFVNVPPEKIDQVKSLLAEQSDYCGCFGAHIAKCFDKWDMLSGQATDPYVFWMEDGEKIWKNNLSYRTRKLFLKKIRPNSKNYSQLFSTEDWSDHPYKVIIRVIAELEG